MGRSRCWNEDLTSSGTPNTYFWNSFELFESLPVYPAAPALDLTARNASNTCFLSILNGLSVARIEVLLPPVVSITRLPDPDPFAPVRV